MVSEKVPSDSYCVQIAFEPHTRNPERVFQAMSHMILGFGQMDEGLVEVFGLKARPVLLLESVESGSLRTWLMERLEEVSDRDLSELNLRRIIGRYLVGAKHRVLQRLRRREGQLTSEDIKDAEAEVNKLAESERPQHLLCCKPVRKRTIIEGLRKLSDGLHLLGEKDSASYIGGGQETPLARSILMPAEAWENLLTRETMQSRSEMIMTVKKPDYLGESQWEFAFDNRIITVTIGDREWLRAFQAREVVVQPGDALRAEVQTEVAYGESNEVVRTHYEAVRVLEVLRGRPESQGKLLGGGY